MLFFVLVYRLALTVLLCFLLTHGLPTDLKCQGKRKNGLIYYELSSDITKQIQDCEVQWLIKVIISIPKTACSYRDLINDALFCFITFTQCCDCLSPDQEKVMALYDGNMRFEHPILNATVNAAIMEDDSEVTYTIDCPRINVSLVSLMLLTVYAIVYFNTVLLLLWALYFLNGLPVFVFQVHRRLSCSCKFFYYYYYFGFTVYSI